MPRDTAWIEEMVADRQQPSTEELRQVDFAEAGLCDLPHFEPAPPKFGDITKLHLLLKVACDDFAKVLLDPRYRIAVDTAWHNPGGGRFFKRCDVCVAGAVIAKSFGQPRHLALGPGAFGSETAKRLEAIGVLRYGDVSEALTIIHGDVAPEMHWEASDMTSRWEPRLDGICDASDRVTGFALLGGLREMQAELKAADL